MRGSAYLGSMYRKLSKWKGYGATREIPEIGYAKSHVSEQTFSYGGECFSTWGHWVSGGLCEMKLLTSNKHLMGGKSGFRIKTVSF